MPDVSRTFALPWDESTAVVAALFGLPWRDGTTVGTVFGTPYEPADPPGGGTPTGPDPLEADAVVPSRPSYVLAHTVTVTDMRDGDELQFVSMSIKAEEGSVCWTLNAEAATDEMFARMTREGDPPLLSVVVDGIEWRFIVESVRRSRQFARSGVSIVGRSVTIAADAPYQFERNWVNQGITSAAQIVDMAQAETGLELDWLLEDWLVPDRVYSFSGTPMAVARRVAESVGAVIISDRKENRITIAPRFPIMPNEWPYVPPDVEIEMDAVTTEGYSREDKPAYNGVYVSGQQQGVVGYVRLEGTNGTFLAPLVTDLLLTDAAAVRQRGEAILASGGPQCLVTQTLPVLTGEGEAGVLNLNQLCRVIDPDGTWWGVVRSVTLQVSLPSVLQTVVLERRTGYVPGTVVGIDAVLNETGEPLLTETGEPILIE